jgi:hypothetical protein
MARADKCRAPSSGADQEQKQRHMAIWQFDLYLIPLASVRTPADVIPAQITEAQWKQGGWWQGSRLLPAYAQQLDQFLPRCQCWHGNPYCWGWELGDFLEIEVTNNEITRMYLRLDARAIEPPFLRQLTAFAQTFDLLFLRFDTLQLIPAEFDLLLCALRDSPEHTQAQVKSWWMRFPGRKTFSFEAVLERFLYRWQGIPGNERKDH